MTMTIYEDLGYDTLEEKLDDYRPPHVRAADNMIQYFRENPPVFEPASPPVTIDPIEEIARLIRGLTYGQMIELASGLGHAPQDIHRWAQAIRGL